jgi:hypothetical protein
MVLDAECVGILISTVIVSCGNMVVKVLFVVLMVPEAIGIVRSSMVSGVVW